MQGDEEQVLRVVPSRERVMEARATLSVAEQVRVKVVEVSPEVGFTRKEMVGGIVSVDGVGVG